MIRLALRFSSRNDKAFPIQRLCHWGSTRQRDGQYWTFLKYFFMGINGPNLCLLCNRWKSLTPSCDNIARAKEFHMKTRLELCSWQFMSLCLPVLLINTSPETRIWWVQDCSTGVKDSSFDKWRSITEFHFWDWEQISVLWKAVVFFLAPNTNACFLFDLHHATSLNVSSEKKQRHNSLQMLIESQVCFLTLKCWVPTPPFHPEKGMMSCQAPFCQQQVEQ